VSYVGLRRNRMGGKHQPVGSTRVAPNGYHYTKVADNKGPESVKNWRLTHHLVAERKLGRALLPDERVEFVDKTNRLDLRPENVNVVKKRPKTRGREVAAIRSKIEDLKAQLSEMGEEVCCHD
jgi:hypothetical protein